MPHPLEPFFSPRGVALLGATEQPRKAAGAILRNLLESGFQGAVYPINPKYGTVHGLPCYPSVRGVPDPVDLAVLAIPARSTVEVLDDLADRGIRHAIVISAGFGEMGNEGEALQERLRRQAANLGIRVLGPNCLGILDTASHLNTFFLPKERLGIPPRGRIAIVSQSGSFAACLVDLAAAQGLGISKAISFGNRLDVGEVELLEYLAQDPETRVVALYLESVAHGRRFIEAAKICGQRKPVLALKVGRFEAGVRAARSHTGALAGRQEIYEAAFKKAGVLEVTSFDGFLEAAKALALQPPAPGNRVLIITDGGGMGVAAVDHCSHRGLTLPDLPHEIQARLASRFPSFYSIANPLDLTGNVTDEDYRLALEEAFVNGPYDACLVIALMAVEGLTESLVEVVARARERAGRPVVVCSVGGDFTQKVAARFEASGLPVYGSPERAVRALAVLSRRGLSCPDIRTSRAAPFQGDGVSEARQILEEVASSGRSALLEDEAKDFIKVLGLPAPDHFMAEDMDAALRAANTLGYPVVLKIVSPDILHKSDVGGVRVGAGDKDSLAADYEGIIEAVREQVPDARVRGMLVEQMAPPGVEVVVGGLRDPQFGPTVMFGLGGIAVEVLRDVSFALAPLTRDEALALLQGVKAAPLLAGFRGSPALDEEALANVLVAVGDILEAFPEIVEMDLNPVLAYPEGVQVADVRVVLGTG